MLKKELEACWREQRGGQIEFRKTSRVHGGDISQCYALETTEGNFFLKVQEGSIPEGFFEKEYRGLVRLMESQSVAVPAPLFYGSADGQQFLVIEFIHKAPPQQNFWRVFAERLAVLHRCSDSLFGLSEDNYIGTLPQINRQEEDWGVFYAYRRLEPLIRRCVDEQLLSKSLMRSSDRLFGLLSGFFPPEKPALLHGDLWGGNYLSGSEGMPVLFDPAVYYGNREMDLAMTRLFGGFDRKFYWYYEDYFPLAEGWQERIPICQLYPLLVHALLFGGGYVQQVRNILSGY